jgi:hypothetical protein
MRRIDPFHPDNLRVSMNGSPKATAEPSRRPPRHRRGRKFLRGPVPWDWLARAGRLPGCALAVGLVLWQEAGYHRRRTVPYRPAVAAELGVSPKAGRNGLRALEGDRLISIRRPPGRCLEITLLDAPVPSAEVRLDDAERCWRCCNRPCVGGCGQMSGSAFIQRRVVCGFSFNGNT